VIEFADAESALQALVAGLEHIDIAVVDLSLPGLSGDLVIAELHKRRPGLPVLLMSGHVAQPEALNVPFLAKPFRASELLSAVSGLVEAGRRA
jgi:DNA-binding NtrC family response regulator